jgi:hypothetical protein
MTIPVGTATLEELLRERSMIHVQHLQAQMVALLADSLVNNKFFLKLLLSARLTVKYLYGVRSSKLTGLHVHSCKQPMKARPPPPAFCLFLSNLSLI